MKFIQVHGFLSCFLFEMLLSFIITYQGSSWLLNWLNRWWDQLERGWNGHFGVFSAKWCWVFCCNLLGVDGQSLGPDSWWCAVSVYCVTCDLPVNNNSECDVSICFVWRMLVEYRFRGVFLKFIIGRIIVIRWPVGY